LLGFLRVLEQKKDPGLKPIDSIGLIQGDESPCSLRKTKTGVFPQPVKPHLPQEKAKAELLWEKGAGG
jgi:hypothetical protein